MRAGVGAGDSCAPLEELGAAVVVRGLAFDQHRAALVLACFAEAVVATVGMVFDLDTVEMPTSRLAQNLIRLCYRLGYVPRTLREVMAFVRGFGPLIIIDGAPLEEEERREKTWPGMPP